MALYEILRDGEQTVHLTAGMRVELSDDLAAVAVGEGWARPVSAISALEQVAENVKIGTLHMKRNEEESTDGDMTVKRGPGRSRKAQPE